MRSPKVLTSNITVSRRLSLFCCSVPLFLWWAVLVMGGRARGRVEVGDSRDLWDRQKSLEAPGTGLPGPGDPEAHAALYRSHAS